MISDRSIWPGEPSGDFVSTITALKLTSDLERAELIVGLCVEHVLNRHFPRRLLERASPT
ncbi:hypothetical protein [Paraburkholderia gardini]|uniref:hypothetical protein n=1 Tax=Paraburkholderia gardini TaxID=2823469 RepID=UPI001E489AD0|nr:hypothetical protein [Paraburkholderia gardini]